MGFPTFSSERHSLTLQSCVLKQKRAPFGYDHTTYRVRSVVRTLSAQSRVCFLHESSALAGSDLPSTCLLREARLYVAAHSRAGLCLGLCLQQRCQANRVCRSGARLRESEWRAIVFVLDNVYRRHALPKARRRSSMPSPTVTHATGAKRLAQSFHRVFTRGSHFAVGYALQCWLNDDVLTPSQRLLAIVILAQLCVLL